MPNPDSLADLRSDLDYDALIEKASPALRLYVRALEQENARLRQEVLELRESGARRQRAVEARVARPESAAAQLETVRHPEDMMVIAITRLGLAKRTPLNDYSTQRRGGLGVYDIQTGRDDAAAHLLTGRASATLLILTNRGRAFRVAIDTLPLTDVRGRGGALPERLMLTPDETIAAAVVLDDADPRPSVLVATAAGWVRPWHRNYLGPRLQPGTLLYEPQRGGGAPAAITLAHGDGDVLLALRSGLAYRFAESQVRRDGVRGIQVHPEDAVVGIASVRDESTVLFVTADGQGARRAMSGFSANKTPGGQGKIIMKTDALVGVAAVDDADEALLISGLAKIIRFGVADVPVKAGSVQGVNVMDCRNDTLTALAIAPAPEETV
jgi:DNA gyrase subunit A